jgi:GPH family glycoside/pentoside/hexuronide:cation symporter
MLYCHSHLSFSLKQEDHVEIDRKHLILYASGSLATAISYQAFATYVQFLYIDIYGLKAAWVGIVWAIYGLWNAVNDPLAGYWSDKTNTRFGRRIPWIAGLFIPLSITFYFLFVPPGGLTLSGGIPLLIYFLIFVLVFDLLWSLVVMNWTALFPEMVPDEKMRAEVSAYREVFSLIGLMIGVALPPLIAGEDWSSVSTVALLVSVLTAFFFGLSLLGSREQRAFQEDEPLSFMDSIRFTMTNRDFLFFLGANLMIQFSFLALTATIPFYAKYALRIQSPTTLAGITLDPGLQNSLLLGGAILMALPGMALWTVVAKRIGVWRSLRICTLISAVVLLLFFAPDDFLSGLFVTTFFGLGLAGLLMLTNPLIADMVDEDELNTGARREGLYFGMNGFVIRFAFTIQGLIAAAIFSSTGYIAPAGDVLYPEQPAAAVWGIRSMIALFPPIGLAIGYFLLGGYSLHGQRLQTVQTDVADLHKQKRKLIANTQ